jgi:hypothetical protein
LFEISLEEAGLEEGHTARPDENCASGRLRFCRNLRQKRNNLPIKFLEEEAYAR